MDTDIKRAVLAAFDNDGQANGREPKKDSGRTESVRTGSQAVAAVDESAEGTRRPSTKKELAEAARRHVELGGSRPGASSSGKTSGGGTGGAQAPGSWGGGFQLFLSVAMVLLLLVMTYEIFALRQEVAGLSHNVRNGIKDVRNYARLKVATYAVPGKPPQQVLTVVEIKDGVPKLVATEVRPLDE